MRDDKHPPTGCCWVTDRSYPAPLLEPLAYPELAGSKGFWADPSERLDHEDVVAALDAMKREKATPSDVGIILAAFAAYGRRVEALEADVEKLETWRARFGRGFYARRTAAQRNAWVRQNLKRAAEGRTHDTLRLAHDWTILTLCGAGNTLEPDSERVAAATGWRPGACRLPDPLLGVAREGRYQRKLEVDGCPLRSVAERDRAVKVLTYLHDFSTERACRAALHRALPKLRDVYYFERILSPGTNKPASERGGT